MDVYIDTSQTYNGDGTSSASAASEGAVGAYNDIQSFLTAASTSGQTRGIVRRLDLGTSIDISAPLEPVADGTQLIPLHLIGYPYSKTINGAVVSIVDNLSRENGTYFQFASATTTIGDSANYDHHWENAEITIHQSGSDNDGLTRCCMWSKWDSTNSRMDIGVFPDLPDALTTSATFDITLSTPEYGDISVSAWDGDTNSAPIIDTGANAITAFYPYSDELWKITNFKFEGTADSYTFIRVPTCERIIINRPDGWGIASVATASYGNSWYKDVFVACKDNPLATQFNSTLFTNLHINTTQGRVLNYPRMGRFDSASFSKITDGDYVYYFNYSSETHLEFNNIDLILTASSGLSTPVAYANPLNCFIRFTNSRIDGTFRKLVNFGVGCTTKTITSADTSYWATPPSGTDFILFCTMSAASNTFPVLVNRSPALLTADTEKTITVKINPADWTTDLTNADIWIEVKYFDEATGIHQETITSKGTGTTYTDGSWSNLSVTFTPKQSSMEEVLCYLVKYKSGSYIRIDPNSGA